MNNNDIILKALDVTYAYPEEDGAPDETHAALDGLPMMISLSAVS